MSALDLFVAYKFIKMLSTPFEKTDAYKLGIIDKDGNILKKKKELKTGKEKIAYTIFHRLAWNLKKLLNRFPPTKTRLGSFAAALFLLREHANCKDDTLIERAFLDFLNSNGYDIVITESLEEAVLSKGDYTLKVDLQTDDGPINKGDIVRTEKDKKNFQRMLGKPLFKVTHLKTGKELVVSDEDLERIK